MTLLWRVTTINVAVLVVAAAALALSPATISADVRAAEAAVLAAGAAVVLLANVLLLRRVFAPLAELTQLMSRVDLRRPGERIEVDHAVAEVTRLEKAFNAMLDRLEDERRSSGRRALDSQERERRRMGRELHDELGQTLTGVLLLLDGLAHEAPAALRPAVEEVQEAARGAVEKTRDLARGLRPAGLEEFGLRAALATLASGVSERSGLVIRHDIDPALPELDPEQTLAIYRTTQESLVNVVRHAAATTVEIYLESGDGHVTLRVADDGRGAEEDQLHEAGGIGGMRERAMLAGGALRIGAAALGGTEIRLRIPAGART